MEAGDTIGKLEEKSETWVTYKGKVLDISDFLPTHPGGDSVILPYIGKDITKAFEDADHSEVAEGMIKSLVIGNTEEHSMKIDPYKGTLYQVWTKLNLKDYVEFVNAPNSIIGHMKVFDTPWLEVFTMTPWHVIPTVWVPIILFYLHSAYVEIRFFAFLMFIVGFFYWTLFEYIMHRFGFHSEMYLPDNHYVIALHYAMHGIHHAYPMDSLRLVFPPALGAIFAVFFKTIYNFLMPLAFSHAFMAGKLTGYLWYDLFHYFAHHMQAKTGYFSFMKKYHLAHHYKNSTLGFGVSNHFWDLVFGTQIVLTAKSLSE